jgi:hypothetical protein
MQLYLCTYSPITSDPLTLIFFVMHTALAFPKLSLSLSSLVRNFHDVEFLKTVVVVVRC